MRNVCLVDENPDVLRARIVGMRGPTVLRSMAMHDTIITLPLTTLAPSSLRCKAYGPTDYGHA